MTDDRLYLLYISECIRRIQQYTADGNLIVDLNLIWDIIERDLSDLKGKVEEILKALT